MKKLGITTTIGRERPVNMECSDIRIKAEIQSSFVGSIELTIFQNSETGEIEIFSDQSIAIIPQASNHFHLILKP